MDCNNIVFENSKFMLNQLNGGLGCRFKDITNENLREVAQEALERMQTIEGQKDKTSMVVGDIVEVVDNEYALCQYDKFFNDSKVPTIYAIKYRYGVYPENGVKGTVVYVKDSLCVIEVKEEKEFDMETSAKENISVDSCIYLMNYLGLKKVK